jgi:3-hydroxyacyl-[acyl-carrier-protein] dehydratase
MTEDAKVLATADIHKILALLPHRYPFLMVDRIVDIDRDESARGIKNVSFNEPHFQGHFPRHPVMPGVLILEGMAQTAGAICIANAGKEGPPGVVYLMTIDGAKFRRPVVPGDVLEYHVRKTRSRGAVWKFQCQGIVAGTKVAEAEISAMLIDQ